MANDENEQLRKEMDRQNRIIDALLDNNTHLKQALNWYQHLFTHPQHPIYSNDNLANTIPQAKEAIEPGKDEVNKLPDDVLSRINGVIEEFDYIRNHIIGVNNKTDAYPLQKDGVNQLPDTSAPVMVGGNEGSDALPQVMIGGNEQINTIDTQHGVPSSVNSHAGLENTLAQLQKDNPSQSSAGNHDLLKTYRYNGKEVALFTNTPQDIAAGKLPVSYNKLYALLRKNTVKASVGGLVNTAQILMKLYQSPAQSMKSLRQLTHLSEDGMTKRIMAMKKSGLIVRAPGRQLLLTAKAHHLLNEAR